MAITNTSLAAALSATSLTLTATSATGATVGGFAKVDGEFMIITKITGTSIAVGQRGTLGTAVVAHKVLAPLTFGLHADLTDMGATEVILPVFEETDVVTIGANGVIDVPVRDTIFVIQKATALATSTFANPSAAQNGLTVTFFAGTDAAHVITTTTVNDGTTGAHTTLTFAAFIGASITLTAVKGAWYVKANNLVTIT